jgi:hypothetical protein
MVKRRKRHGQGPSGPHPGDDAHDSAPSLLEVVAKQDSPKDVAFYSTVAHASHYLFLTRETDVIKEVTAFLAALQ